MEQLLSPYSNFKIGCGLRRLIIILCLILLFFHLLVLLIIFSDSFTRILMESFYINDKIYNIDEFVDRVIDVSKSVSGLTFTFILLLIFTECQRSIHYNYERDRIDAYEGIKLQILSWLNFPCENKEKKIEEKQIFIENNVQILRCLKVHGKEDEEYFSPEDDYDYKILNNMIKKYNQNVHFEITQYPTEIIYGIHFEFEDKIINKLLYDKIIGILDIDDICFKVNRSIPKNPNWIFWTKTVDLIEDDYKNNMKSQTHYRHFVELVCHAYDIVYGNCMKEFYISYVNAYMAKVCH